MAILRRYMMFLLACALVTGLLGVKAPVASARSNEAEVVDINDKVFGKTYPEWSVAWWQWVFRTRFQPGGPFDSGTVDCSDRQPNPRVLFLSGPFNQSGSVERTCEDPVARGTYILIPVINVECSDVEDPPFYGATPKERRRCVQNPIFATEDLHAKVDGKSIANLNHYDVTSPDFPFTARPGNPALAVDVVTRGNSTSRGVWLMLKPLPRGEHRITFGGSFPNFPFTIEVDYRLTVE